MAASLLFLSVAATASVIDFNTMTGTNGNTFSTYSENGFTVTATQGSWSKGFFFGNPAPNIYCDRCAPGTVAITADSGPFTFASVDLANSQSSSIDTFTIQGFRLGSVVLSQSGSLIFQNGFRRFASADSTVLIDSLVISLTSTAPVFDYNIDNVAVNPIPEPGTAALLGVALTVITTLFLGRIRRIL